MSMRKITVALLVMALFASCVLCGCKKNNIDPETLGNYTVSTKFFSVFVPRGWKVSRTSGKRTATVDMFEYVADGGDIDKRARVQVKPVSNLFTEQQMLDEFAKTVKKRFGSPISKVKLGDITYHFSSWLIYDVVDADKYDFDEPVTNGSKEAETEAPVGGSSPATTDGDGAKVRLNTKNRTELLFFDEVTRQKVTISVIGSLEALDLQEILDSVKLTLDGSGDNSVRTAADTSDVAD